MYIKNFKYNLKFYIYNFLIFKDIKYINHKFVNLKKNYFEIFKVNKKKIINNFFLTKKKLFIIFYRKFLLKIDLLSFLCLFKFLYYLQLRKYLSYLYFLFFCYPLIYKFLSCCIKLNPKILYCNKSILNKFQIYNYNLKKLEKKKNKLNNVFIKQNKNIKLLLIYINKSFIFLFCFIKTLFNLFFFFSNYKILFDYIRNLQNMKFIQINTLFSCVQKKIFNLNNQFTYFYNYKLLKINNIWLNLIQLIIVEYIDILFFKFFNEINYYKLNFKFKKMWLYSWIILKRSFIFNWIRLNNTNLTYKQNDIIIWKIFYLNQWYFYRYIHFNVSIQQLNIKLQSLTYWELNQQNNKLRYLDIMIYLWKFKEFYKSKLLYNKYKNIIKFIINLFKIINFNHMVKVNYFKQINYKFNYVFIQKFKNQNFKRYKILYKNKFLTYYNYKYNIMLVIIFFSYRNYNKN